jgi:hypothetical protein
MSVAWCRLCAIVGNEEVFGMTTMPQPIGIQASRMTDGDARVALERAVRRSGFSVGELRQQARDGEFKTLRARLAWIAVQAIEGA